MRSVLEARVAGRMPISFGRRNFRRGDQSGDRLDVSHEFRMLPKPVRFGARQVEENAQHVLFPSGVEAASALTPLQIPVPDTGKDQETKGQLAERNASL